MAGPQVILKMDKLLALEREHPGRAAQMIRKTANLCVGIIGQNWNSLSPAPEGEPPGVDIGNLKNSIEVTPGAEPLTDVVHDGVPYGVHLEYGTENMGARPWLLPAVEQTAEMLPAGWLQEVVK